VDITNIVITRTELWYEKYLESKSISNINELKKDYIRYIFTSVGFIDLNSAFVGALMESIIRIMPFWGDFPDDVVKNNKLIVEMTKIIISLFNINKYI
jgi:hypothetical protein